MIADIFRRFRAERGNPRRVDWPGPGAEQATRGWTLRSGRHGHPLVLQPEPRADRGRQGRRRQDHHGGRAGPPGRRGRAVGAGHRARGPHRRLDRLRGCRRPRLRGRGPARRRGERLRRRSRRRGGAHPARHRPRPDHHPGRRPPRVPRRPRDEAVLQAAPVLGDHRHRGRGHPGHPRHPRPRQGQADRTAADRRPGAGRRPGHRSHHDLPVVGRRPARRRPGRAHPGPGGRRGRPPVQPRALPGGPGHPARGDAGQRGGRGRLPARGPGGHRASDRSSSTPAIRRWSRWPRRRPTPSPRPASDSIRPWSTPLEAGPPLPPAPPRAPGASR